MHICKLPQASILHQGKGTEVEHPEPHALLGSLETHNKLSARGGRQPLSHSLETPQHRAVSSAAAPTGRGIDARAGRGQSTGAQQDPASVEQRAFPTAIRHGGVRPQYVEGR